MAAMKNSATRRLLWFAGLWVGGVVVTALFAYGLRAIFSL